MAGLTTLKSSIKSILTTFGKYFDNIKNNEQLPNKKFGYYEIN